MDVKHLCLGVLTLGDATGYDIKKTFEQSFRHFFSAGYGSIYPALAELHRRGLVECHQEVQEKLPDKKVYRITEEGRTVFVESLTRTAPRHKVRSTFLVQMYFAQMLSPERLRDVLEERLVEVESTLEFLMQFEGSDFSGTPGVEFSFGYGKHMLAANRDYIREAGKRLLDSVTEQQAGDDSVVSIKNAKQKS